MPSEVAAAQERGGDRGCRMLERWAPKARSFERPRRSLSVAQHSCAESGRETKAGVDGIRAGAGETATIGCDDSRELLNATRAGIAV